MQAIVYTRFSPRPDADSCQSCEKQLERCRAYCAAYGWEIIAEESDPDASGGRADNRPGLQAALSAVEENQAVLVVYSQDRLNRETGDAMDVLKAIRKAGGRLAVVESGVNTETPEGRLLYTIMAGFATWQRELIVERTQRAMLKYQAQGRRMGSKCPYGSMVDPNNSALLVANEEEQATIRRMMELHSRGLGPRKIANALNADGQFARGGKFWEATTLKKIIKRQAKASAASPLQADGPTGPSTPSEAA